MWMWRCRPFRRLGFQDLAQAAALAAVEQDAGLVTLCPRRPHTAESLAAEQQGGQSDK